jgi:hypothetical protein
MALDDFRGFLRIRKNVSPNIPKRHNPPITPPTIPPIMVCEPLALGEMLDGIEDVSETDVVDGASD